MDYKENDYKMGGKSMFMEQGSYSAEHANAGKSIRL
jgi:hypothetical protein